MSALWVLAVVARPYEWWRVALVAVSGLAYVVIFSIPLARETFMLDPSNVARRPRWRWSSALIGAARDRGDLVGPGQRSSVNADGCGGIERKPVQ